MALTFEPNSSELLTVSNKAIPFLAVQFTMIDIKQPAHMTKQIYVAGGVDSAWVAVLPVSSMMMILFSVHGPAAVGARNWPATAEGQTTQHVIPRELHQSSYRAGVHALGGIGHVGAGFGGRLYASPTSSSVCLPRSRLRGRPSVPLSRSRIPRATPRPAAGPHGPLPRDHHAPDLEVVLGSVWGSAEEPPCGGIWKAEVALVKGDAARH